MTTSPAAPAPVTDRAVPPKAPGLPLLGNSLSMLSDPLSYLVQQYHELGPVFRVKMGFQKYTVLAGYEANRFLASEANDVCSSEGLFGGFAKALDSDVMLTVLDGEAHAYMRRLNRPGFARSALVPHMDTVLAVVRDKAASWEPGATFPVMETVRHIVADQIGLIATGFRLGDDFDDMLFYLNTLMNVHALKVMPKAMLLRPRFKRAEARLHRLSEEILAYHRDVPAGEGRAADYVDGFLESVRPDGKAFTPGDLFSATIGPFFAGMDTLASTLSFYLYALTKHQEVLARVQPEIDALFANGTPSVNDMRKAELLHASALETLRVYPVTPFTPRTAKVDFEFSGYLIPAGTELMFGNTITHYLDEYFAEPERFNIDRWLGDAPPPAPNTFTPYSVGAHTCLGAGLAEMLMMLNAAALLHSVALELETPDYSVPIKTMPLPNPGKEFRLRVAARRA
jgi:cytochrome P450